MKVAVKFDAKSVLKDLKRVRGTHRSVTAAVINKHVTASKRGMVSALRAEFGISAKRLRRRNLVAKKGRARPSRLEAVGITILAFVPARYFIRSVGRGRGARKEIDQSAVSKAVQVSPGVYSIHDAALRARSMVVAGLARTFPSDFTRDLNKRLRNRRRRK